MIEEQHLKKEFEKMQSLLAFLKSESAAEESQIMFSKGPFFDFPAFSYQRKRMQQGRLIKDIKKVKNHNNVYRYSFNDSGNLIREGWGNRLGQFSSIFYLYDKKYLFMSYAYDELESPANVTSYNLQSGRIASLASYGLYGAREEKYFYDGGLLRKIDIYMNEHEDEEAGNVSEYFYYDDAGELESIELVYDSVESETIYETPKTKNI